MLTESSTMDDGGYTKEVANTPGAPPQKRVGERGLRLIEEMAAKGCHKATVAKALRMAVRTLRECRKRQPEVEEAFQRGEAELHDSLFEVLHEEARSATGQKRVTAAIFLLKSRFGYRDQGSVEDDGRSAVAVNINLPASMSLDEFLKSTGGVQVIADGHTERLEANENE